MVTVGNTAPLIAIDAFVVDTETTGLDPSKARIVEIAAIRLSAGRLEEQSALRALINPGEPIPPSSTRIHKIDDAAVASANGFAAAWPEFSAAISGAVLIGHTLGFDLAVLKRECERAKLRWQPPRTLDTMLLAQVVEPHLGGYTLEHLANWLGVAISDRHSALADATITARIFLALLPKLREGNIRTLAEAEQACLALTGVLEDQHRAGWHEAVAAPEVRDQQSFAPIDSYAYRHRIADVMSAPPKFSTADAALGDALKRMADEKVSSLLVSIDANRPLRPDQTGILTERDVLRALANDGSAALARPVSDFATKPLLAVSADAFLHTALGRMSRLKLRHLGVVDRNGEICGIVTARDLLRMRAQEAAVLGDGLEAAVDVPALAAVWAELPQAAAGLVAEGVGARDIASVISRELATLTRRAGMLAEQRMVAEGRGAPPCTYALCVLGSAGRGESLLAMDQDNAIVFAEGEPGGIADQWFARLGEIVADILHDVGVPYCNGGVMAKNEQWRGSLETWHRRISDWVTRSSPVDLLSVDIFFDLVGVHGDVALADELWRFAFDAAKDNAVFAKLLREAAGEPNDGLTLFGGLRAQNGRIDLKKVGLFGIVSTARVLAIRHHVLEHSTPARLDGVAALSLGGVELETLKATQAILLDFILDQQLADIAEGRPPGNSVAVKRLSRGERKTLAHALGSVRHLDDLTRDLLF